MAAAPTTAHVTELAVHGVKLIEPVVHGDDRGFFVETFRESTYTSAGLTSTFVQHNHSRSRGGVLRGLHFQKRHPQGKLVRVARGAVLDVVADLRRGSPTFGRHVAVQLDDEAHHQLWVPPGLAHGFYVLSDVADVLYLTTDYYRPDDEGGVRWDDPDLAIDWPGDEPTLSERDQALPLLRNLGTNDLPRVDG